MNAHQQQIDILFNAELQFRLASAVRLAVTMGEQPLDVPQQWSHGKHVVGYEEIALRQDQADFAAWSLHRSATFLMAVAIKDAIKSAIPDPKNHSDSDVRSAYQIARLIRNAFAHGPFNPAWSIDPNCRNQVFEVTNLIKMDTSGLDGIPFDWRHYGGPLAILRLSQFVRYEILKEIKSPRANIPVPKNIYHQQGDLILKKIGELNSK
jgi:hypothetical protein